MYAGCPILWSSKFQTEIVLSTAEAGYIALSQAMRQVIPLMNLLVVVEISCAFNIPLLKPKPQVHCKVFKVNQRAKTIAELRKFSPWTKHIAHRLEIPWHHHFWRFVTNKTI